MPQQDDTLAWFRREAGAWQRAVKSTDPDSLNTLQQRYDYILTVAPKSGLAIDLGCGSGDLSVLLAERGLDARGLDFAPEMIELARQEASARKASASFIVGSALEPPAEWRDASLTTALGLIEYLSPDQVRRLFAVMAERTRGAVVVESRNRLFNAVSGNAYTAQEIADGTLGHLLREIARLESGGPWPDILAYLAAADLPVPSDYPRTGIPILRHQYTPGQVAAFGLAAGMIPIEVCGYHYHAVPPSVAASNPSLHAQLARAVQPHVVGTPALLAHCSSFLMRFAWPG